MLHTFFLLSHTLFLLSQVCRTRRSFRWTAKVFMWKRYDQSCTASRRPSHGRNKCLLCTRRKLNILLSGKPRHRILEVFTYGRLQGKREIWLTMTHFVNTLSILIDPKSLHMQNVPWDLQELFVQASIQYYSFQLDRTDVPHFCCGGWRWVALPILCF